MTPEDLIEAVQSELQARFQTAGRGSVKQVQKALNLGESYFRDQRRPGRRYVDLKVLLQTLEVLKVDPAEFFSSILGPFDPIVAFRAEADVIGQRMKNLPAILEVVAERRPEITDDKDPPPEEIDELHRLSHENPKLVRKRIKALVSQVSESALPQLLWLYAAASRVQALEEEAQVILVHALDLAEKQQDSATHARIFLSCGDLLNDRGLAETAAAFGEQATLLLLKVGDFEGLGCSLARQGYWQLELDNEPKAKRSFDSALEHLPADSTFDEILSSRLQCLFGLARIDVQKQNLAKAEQRLKEARPMLNKLTEQQQAEFHKLRKTIEELKSGTASG